jgi:TonB family protein
MRDNLKNDIEKYLRGELSASEMHALEKRALDDPFLADALEGAMQLDASQFASDIKTLEGKIGARIERKVIPMWVWPARIAAGLILIVLSMYVINSLIGKDETNLAVNDTQKTEPAPAPKEKEELKSTDPVASSTETEATEDAKSAKEDVSVSKPEAQSTTPVAGPPAKEPQTLAVKDDNVEEQSLEVKDNDLDKALSGRVPGVAVTPAPDTIQLAVTRDEAVTSQPVIEADDKLRSETAKRKVDKRVANAPANQDGYQSSQSTARNNTQGFVSIPKKVVGRVTFSEDSTGLPGVNVVIKGTNTGTVTDMNGNYQIDLTDPNATLVYSFIGLESKEVAVEDKLSVNVLMDQDVAQLSEVVVTGYGESDSDEEKIYSTFEMAAPAGGRRAFKKYLEEKLVYPQLALDNKVEGRVTIQFTVETSGKLTNFNIIKGIGYGCDSEVIRLIKSGPKWSATKRNEEPVKGKVKVRMRFALPKKK